MKRIFMRFSGLMLAVALQFIAFQAFSQTEGSGIVIRQASGVEQQIPKSRIRQIRPEGRSVMPEGFETTLTPQALADLLACLTGAP